jgi:hypothetical protein
MGDKKEEFEEALRDIDYEDSGMLSLSSIKEVLIELGIHLDEELICFLEYLAFLPSTSIEAIDYVALLEIFDEDYLIK